MWATVQKLYKLSLWPLTWFRHWLRDKPIALVLVLGFFGFIVLAMPSPAWTALVTLYGCLASSAGAACGPGQTGSAVMQLIAIVTVYCIAFLVLSQLVSVVIWSRMRLVTGREACCKALIMGLSPLNPQGLERLPDIQRIFRGRSDLYALSTAKFQKLNIEEAGEPLRKDEITGFAIQWQQNVRAVQHHLCVVERILVLPSEESLAQWPQFKAFMAALFNSYLPVELVTENGEAFQLPDMLGFPKRSFEDYEYLRDGLDRAVVQVRKHPLKSGKMLKESDICIDITAGPKTFSIAGAIVTLNRDLKLGYVSNDGIVSIFDAEIGTADSLTRTLN